MFHVKHFGTFDGRPKIHAPGAVGYEAGIWTWRDVRIEFIFGHAIFWENGFPSFGTKAVAWHELFLKTES